MMVVNEERERVEAWDPAAGQPLVAGSVASGSWWLQEMARDRGGNLHRALAAARRAATLVRSPAEAYRVAEHLARLEHEAGEHQQELLQAKRMIVLDPNNQLSLVTLRRAQACRGLRK
jgi:hypothetical protein